MRPGKALLKRLPVRRWLWDNFESLLFASVLALSIWMAGTSAADPIVERVFPSPIPITYNGPADGLLIVGDQPSEARVTVRAPTSVWERLTSVDLQVIADLSTLEAGRHGVPLQASVGATGARITVVDPAQVDIAIEQASERIVPVRVQVTGETAAGYRTETPTVSPTEVTVVGPSSVVERVVGATAPIDLAGADRDVDVPVTLRPVDSAGQLVVGAEVQPASAQVQVNVSLPGGFRSVAVLPLLTDQVEPGYRVTNVTVTPPTVVLFSSDPAAVESLPGFVQTEPISLANATATIQHRALIDMPKGFSAIDEPSVLVEVTIEPIVSSITLACQVEVVGLAPGLYAQAAPNIVSVILDGPLPVLESLAPADVQVVVDVLGQPVGTHQIQPEVIVLPDGVTVRTVLPDSIEVTVSRTPFATPTPLP
jgi:YbbR domain-containing protein